MRVAVLRCSRHTHRFSRYLCYPTRHGSPPFVYLPGTSITRKYINSKKKICFQNVFNPPLFSGYYYSLSQQIKKRIFMAIADLKNVLNIFGGADVSEEQQNELFKEVLLMTLARAADADINIQSAEIEKIQEILKDNTGEDFSAAEWCCGSLTSDTGANCRPECRRSLKRRKQLKHLGRAYGPPSSLTTTSRYTTYSPEPIMISAPTTTNRSGISSQIR